MPQSGLSANDPIADASKGIQTASMSSTLKFQYEFSRDDDDFGWLGVAVASDSYSGRGGFFVQWQDVKEFGEKLADYPIDAATPIKAAWGYEPWEGDALVIMVEISPSDKRGNLAVKVWLRDHTEMGEGEPSNCIRTTFETNYPDLDAFRLGIESMMDRKADEAVLVGR